MLVVAPDFDRRIDLPGAGLCPRPVDIDRSKAALERLVSLRVYSFASGVEIDGEAEGDEVFIVLMRGAATIAVAKDGIGLGTFTLGEVGEDRVIYMPPHASYHLTAVSNCDIAYARCDPAGEPAPVRAFAPVASSVSISGHAGGMELSLARVAPGTRSIASGGGSPERFVHVRGDGGLLRLGGGALGDWGSAILLQGDTEIAEIEGNSIDILMISATAR